MVYLNYSNLDAETQQHLLEVSKNELEQNFGRELKVYAEKHRLDYEALLYEEAARNLYNYKYVFHI